MSVPTTRSELISKTENLLTKYSRGDECVDTIGEIIDNLSALAGLRYSVGTGVVASLSPADSAQARPSTIEGDR